MAVYIPIISEFNSKGIDKAVKEFKSLEGAGQKANFAIKKAAVPAALALAGLGTALFDATKGAMEDEAAQALLASTIKKTTGATDAQIKANEDWISTQGKLLGVTDDELRPVLAKLVKSTGSVTKAQELASAAMDIAASTGKPLATVTDSLAKAYGGNMAALAKLSPELRQMIKDGASFDEVMAAMAKTTGGAATDAANTAQGKFKRLGVSLSETKEAIGAALIPVIEKVLPYLIKMGDWASKNTTAFMIVAGAIGAIAAAIVIVNAVTKAWTAATLAFNAVMAVNPVVLIVLAVVALIAALVIAYQKFEAFRNIVDTVFKYIKQSVMGSIEIFKTYFTILLDFYKGIFNGIAKLWNNTIGKMEIKIPDIPGLPGRGKTFGVPNIPYLAEGGIVTSAQLAVIGEKGPEAVIPLSKMGNLGMGGDTNVTIQVNGGDPNAVVDALRRYMQLNGSVPIRVSA
jgi:hypothetical protein